MTANQRTCYECQKPIYYGLFCTSYCSNINYERYKRNAERCGCKDCSRIEYPEEGGE